MKSGPSCSDKLTRYELATNVGVSMVAHTTVEVRGTCLLSRVAWRAVEYCGELEGAPSRLPREGVWPGRPLWARVWTGRLAWDGVLSGRLP